MNNPRNGSTSAMHRNSLRKTSRWPQDWPLWAQFALSIGAVMVALALRWAVDGMLLGRLPWITVFIVLMPLVLLVRPLPFLVAALLGCIGTLFFFMLPRFTFRVEGPMAELQIGLFLLAVIAAT